MNRNFLPPEQEAMRQKCHELKLSDIESAKVCGISSSAYCSWRNKKGLPIHKGKYNVGRLYQGYNRNEKVKEINNRVVLTAEDIGRYKHNDNTRKDSGNTYGQILIRVDKEEAEARCREMGLGEPIGELNKGVKPPMIVNGLVIGFPNFKETGKLYNSKSIRDKEHRPQIRKVGY